MNVQLVTTGSRKWVREDSTPAWGLGVQVREIAEGAYLPPDGDVYEIERFGFLIEFMVGPWMLMVWTDRAYEGFFGPHHLPLPFFEKVGSP